MAEPTLEEQHKARREAREKADKARATSGTVEERTYKLAPGEYAGDIGGEEGTIKVGDGGTYSTRKAAEQGFIESTLGAEPTSSKKKEE